MKTENMLVISSVVLWVIVAFNLLLTLALVRRSNKTQIYTIPEMLKEGDKVPTFEARDLEGHRVSLDNYSNTELAMVFVSPTCSACIEQIPFLNNLYPTASKAGVQLILVSLSDEDATKSFLSENKFVGSVIVAPPDQNSIMRDFKIELTPSYYSISPEGKVKSAGTLDAQWKQLIAGWSKIATI